MHACTISARGVQKSPRAAQSRRKFNYAAFGGGDSGTHYATGTCGRAINTLGLAENRSAE